MKRSLAVALSLLFLAGTSMVWADATTTTKTVKTVKHHKKGKGGKKSELNPQPLPPRKAPGTAGNPGAPTGDRSTVQ